MDTSPCHKITLKTKTPNTPRTIPKMEVNKICKSSQPVVKNNPLARRTTTPVRPAQTSPVRLPQTSPVRPSLTSPVRPSQTSPVRPAQTLPVRPAQTSPVRPAQTSPVRPAQTSPVRPAQTSPVRSSYIVKPESKTSVKKPSRRLSQRSLFTKQPKVLTKTQQEQLDRRFSELSDNVLKVVRTPSPFTKQSLETLLTQQLTLCLNLFAIHPSVTPLFIRATRDLLVSLVREYEEGDISSYLVLEGSSAAGTFLEAESAETLRDSYRDRYLKELVVNVLQGLCGHKQTESMNMKMLSEASREKIREIRKLVKADSGISPETLEKLERRLDDLKQTLSSNHLDTKIDQNIYIPGPALQALKATCVKTCALKRSSAQMNRRPSSICFIQQTAEDGSKTFRPEFETITNPGIDHALQNIQKGGLDSYGSCSDHDDALVSNFEHTICNNTSGYRDSDDEITQDEAKIYIEAFISDKKRKSHLRNVRTLEVISEEEEIVVEIVSLNLGCVESRTEENSFGNEHEATKYNVVGTASAKLDRSAKFIRKPQNLQIVGSSCGFIDKIAGASKTIEPVHGKAYLGLIRSTPSTFNMIEIAKLNPEVKESFSSVKLIKDLNEFNKTMEETDQLKHLHQSTSDIRLMDGFACDISKEIKLVHEQIQLSPSRASNILNIRETSELEPEITEISSLGTQNWKRVEFSINELTLILLNISKRLKKLPSFLKDFGVGSNQKQILLNLFEPYLSRYPGKSTMNTEFVDKVSAIYFRLAEILNRTPQKLKTEPMSVLNPPQTLMKTLATIARTDFFKDCFVSSIVEFNEEELENITSYDILEKSNTVENYMQETQVRESAQIDTGDDLKTMKPSVDVEQPKKGLLAEKNDSSILLNVESSLALRYAIQRNLAIREDSNGDLANYNSFLGLSTDMFTLQNVSDMFLLFSTILNDVPTKIKSRGILTLNPPASLLQALDILYTADVPCNPSGLKDTNNFSSLTLQDAANFFLILSKTLENTPLRLRNSSIFDLNPPESFLKAVRLLSSLSHSDSQDEVDSQSSQDHFFDALDYIELLECA